MGIELLLGRGADDDRDDPVPEPVVAGADDRNLLDPRMPRKHVLDLERMDVLAAGHDHVVHAPDDPQVSFLVDVADVAGAVPPVVDSEPR